MPLILTCVCGVIGCRSFQNIALGGLCKTLNNMKLQLDTTSKLIKVEETVNLGEFIEALERLLPNGKWKEFKLETQTVINWSNSIVIEPYRPYTLPWWQQPWITYGSNKTQADYSLNSGVYNVEM